MLPVPQYSLPTRLAKVASRVRMMRGRSVPQSKVMCFTPDPSIPVELICICGIKMNSHLRLLLVCSLFVLVIYTGRTSAQEGVLESYFSAVSEAVQTGNYAKIVDELEGAVGQLEDDRRRAPQLASLLSVLSLIYVEMGRIDEAHAYAARARKIVERPVSRNHSYKISTFNFLGRVSLKLNDFAEAERLIERAVALTEDLAENNYGTFLTVQSLSMLRRHVGRDREAEELLKQVLAIAAGIYLDPQGIDVIVTEIDLGDLYVDESRYAEAETQLDAVMVKIRSAFGPNHPLVVRVLLSQADLYKYQARYFESERRYQQSFAILKASAALDTLPRANALSSLGDLAKPCRTQAPGLCINPVQYCSPLRCSRP